MGYGRIVMIGFLTLLLAPFITAPLAASNGYPYPNPRETGWGPYVGPYVDKIVLHEIHSKDQQVLALQDGDIDLITDSIDPSRLESIREVDTIEIVNKSTNSLVAISFNCMKYPYNITALRRAIAIAIDKNETIRRIQGSGIPLDTCVPSINPYSAEGFLDSSYYSSDLAGARALLTSAGFVDWDEQDGFLEAPDHTELVVKLEYPFESESAEVVCNAVIETLLSLNIRAEAVGRSSADYYMKYWMHEDYDAAFIKVECDGLNIDWLGNEYWSGNSKRDYFNIPNFSNDSYDSYRNHLLFSMYPDEIYEAAFEMQRIWTFQCPMVVLYEEIQYIAYRTDKFENFSTDTIFGPLSWWTMSGIHLRDELGGPYGGTFRMGVSDLIDTFNPLFSDHWASWQPHSLMYDSLLRRGPEGEHYPWLAGHLLIETNSDNPKVPTNHTRLTFSLKPSMQWTDNHPITAEDVAYTINLLRELQNETLPNNLEDLFAAYNIGDSVVVAEFSTESLWHLYRVGYIPILPKHFINSLEDVNAWRPELPQENSVTSGIFNVSDWVDSEFIELEYNPTYFYSDDYLRPTTISSPSLNGRSIPEVYLRGARNEIILWRLTDGFPTRCEIYVNEILMANESLSWTSDRISLNLSRLDAGFNEIRLLITAYNGDVSSNTVGFTLIEQWQVGLGLLILLVAIASVISLLYLRRNAIEGSKLWMRTLGAPIQARWILLIGFTGCVSFVVALFSIVRSYSYWTGQVTTRITPLFYSSLLSGICCFSLASILFLIGSNSISSSKQVKSSVFLHLSGFILPAAIMSSWRLYLYLSMTVASPLWILYFDITGYYSSFFTPATYIYLPVLFPENIIVGFNVLLFLMYRRYDRLSINMWIMLLGCGIGIGAACGLFFSTIYVLYLGYLGILPVVILVPIYPIGLVLMINRKR